MNVFANIPGFAKLVYCLKYLRVNKKEIEAAKAAGDHERERKYILKSTATWGPMVMETFGSEVNVRGFENLPDEGPVVFVGNHQGYADIVAYCAVFTKFQFGFVAKDALSKIPLYGEWIRRIRSVFIERNDPRSSLKAINEGIKYVEQGFSLAIFPEGTRSKGPVPGPFHKGSLKLATKPGVPIVPVSLNGSYKMFEEKGRLTGAKIDVLIHPPIETTNITRQEEKELTEKVEKIIVDGLKELQAPE
ncbi:MAG: lysophospholipid acyltransferase family protein [Bacillota bacterium]|nr:lysophospholipid acyltransferase family protein [Bacillota bacterium]